MLSPSLRFIRLRTFARLTAVVAIFAACQAARAEVEFDGLFSRGGVLQRGVAVPIFGTGDDGDDVIVTFQGKSASTKVKDGKWRVELGPLEAGGPYSLTLDGTSSALLKNIYVGDVWVCAGESNMQSPVQSADGYATAITARKNRDLHFYTVKRTGADKPPTSNTTKWSEGAGSATVGVFSAVGYYFGRELAATTDVPIGLIACNHFSSSAEAWTSRESILAEPKLKALVEDAPPTVPWQTPGKLYTGMLLPIADYAIKGVIFYQGETNVERADQYRTLFPLLISDWRKAFNRPDLPFLFVQLNGYKPTSSRFGEGRPAELREAQLEVWKTTPGTAMIVSTDFSDPYNQIPKAKEPIGKRLAFAARVSAYGEKFEYSGPVLREATVADATARLKFDHVGDGLLAKDGKLTGFALVDDDGESQPAEAELEGNEVVVKSDAVKKPKQVRYNWADYPTGNLFNKDGFPASPFAAALTPVKTVPLPSNPLLAKNSDGPRKVTTTNLPDERVAFDGKTLKLALVVDDEAAAVKQFVPEGETIDDCRSYASITRALKLDEVAAVVEAILKVEKADMSNFAFESIPPDSRGVALLSYVAQPAGAKSVEFRSYRISKQSGDEVVVEMYAVRDFDNPAEFLANVEPLRRRLTKLMQTEGLRAVE